jgi:hypothetical protein
MVGERTDAHVEELGIRFALDGRQPPELRRFGLVGARPGWFGRHDRRLGPIAPDSDPTPSRAGRTRMTRAPASRPNSIVGLGP